jgi:hypothetical protein
MSQNKTVTYSFPSTLSLLGILFIGLKLTGYITWSWLWVLAPFWIPLSILFAILGALLVVWGVVQLLEWISRG